MRSLAFNNQEKSFRSRLIISETLAMLCWSGERVWSAYTSPISDSLLRIFHRAIYQFCWMKKEMMLAWMKRKSVKIRILDVHLELCNVRTSREIAIDYFINNNFSSQWKPCTHNTLFCKWENATETAPKRLVCSSQCMLLVWLNWWAVAEVLMMMRFYLQKCYTAQVWCILRNSIGSVHVFNVFFCL